MTTILSYFPKQRRTGLFSATQTRELEDLIRAGLRNPVRINVREKKSETGKGENEDDEDEQEEVQRTPASLNNYYVVSM